MAGGIVASSVLAFHELDWSPWGNILLLVMTMLLAFVMVSNFRYRSFKDLDLKERMPFHYLIFGVGILFVVLLQPEVMLFVLFFSYAILGAVFGVFKLGKNVKKIKSSVYAPSRVDDPDLINEDEFERKS